MKKQQLQFLKTIIPLYTRDMLGLANAFAKTYGVSPPPNTLPYDFNWLEEWHYAYANEQYELEENNLPHGNSDRPISYQGKKWSLHTHDPHWLFTSEDDISVEIYYPDVRRIDACFLLDYAKSLSPKNTIVCALDHDFKTTVTLLDELTQENYLQKLPCHHSGFVYILSSV